MACVTAAPEYKLVFFDLLVNKKEKAGTMLHTEIAKVSICPIDNHLLLVTGPTFFQVLRIQENSFYYNSDQFSRLPSITGITEHA